jgi:hypothetical protein
MSDQGYSTSYTLHVEVKASDGKEAAVMSDNAVAKMLEHIDSEGIETDQFRIYAEGGEEIQDIHGEAQLSREAGLVLEVRS